ncbi:MAG: diguanylate cyclase [Desulfobacterales bacterium]|nr:diguanylate cyclase [Desulfobacterales bacterium]
MLKRNRIEEKESEYHFPILIAEDNPVTRKLIGKILMNAGHEVVLAENGIDALTLFNEKFYPMVVTDWIMPEMNGLELCKAIRSRINQSYVFIVLLTAKDSKYDIITGLEAGADDYLTKPFNKAELLARLKTGIRILELEASLRKVNEEITILSRTDPLTGCYNRCYLNERLPIEIKRAERYRRPLSMILCDIDHFKKVNDKYGHQTGDLILKEFVRCIKRSIRNPLDALVRYGGEEFLLILPETNLSDAIRVAKRICGTISKHAIKVQQNEIYITASFGVTSFENDSHRNDFSADNLIRQADRFLYQAKEEGRNRVKFG